MVTPLAGIRIADLSQVWAGPMATRMLAQMGAEVIKVESPFARGPLRVNSETLATATYPGGEVGERHWNRQGIFNDLNRNKRSLGLDLRSETGINIVRKLIARSDALIENFSPRVMANFGLEYEQLREINPRIVMVSMPGFGSTGPYRDAVAYGPMIEPSAGVASLMGYEDGPPMRTGVALSDPTVGVHGAAALLMGLYQCRLTGVGQHIEISHQEAIATVIGQEFLAYQLTGSLPGRHGNEHPRHAPHNCYRCSGPDHWLAISVRNDEEWRSLCQVMGRPDLEQREDYADEAGRWAGRRVIDAEIARWTVEQEHLDLMHRLQAAGVPAGAVLNGAELVENEHLKARDFFGLLDDYDAGTNRYAGLPIRLAGPPLPARPAPRLGGDNKYVICEVLGYEAAEYEAFCREGVVVDQPGA